MEEKHSSEILGIPDHDEFPIGLKVLAIDANIVCLKYLVHLLHKCQYKVTATTEAAEAIRLLKDEKQAFDIIITNVVRHDMDGFEILRFIIGLGKDIPVVMVSANEELEMVKRGVMEGAEAYLLKPVRLQELKNIWQHVLRKKSARKRSNPNALLLAQPHHPHLLGIISHDHHHQRISIHNQNNNYGSDHQIIESDHDNSNHVSSSSSSKKKRRVSWTPKLHDKFVAAYEQLREKERVPNNILKLMNEPDLTRENVASHLQKHRDMLRKMKATRGVGKLVCQRNCYDRNPTKASTIIYNSMNQIINKFPNLGPQLPINAQFEFPNRARSTMEELQGINGGNTGPTWTAAGSCCFPVPEWFNFPSNNSISRPCDQEGFGPPPSNSNHNLYYPQHPLLETHCLNSTSIPTFGHCPIDDVGPIPAQLAPLASSFPNINTTAGECSQMQFDEGYSDGSLSMDDDLSEIFKQEFPSE